LARIEQEIKLLFDSLYSSEYIVIKRQIIDFPAFQLLRLDFAVGRSDLQRTPKPKMLVRLTIPK
jgi:hypothetical protein